MSILFPKMRRLRWESEAEREGGHGRRRCMFFLRVIDKAQANRQETIGKVSRRIFGYNVER